MVNHHYSVLILGSGAAGLTAAIYASRANLEPTLIHGMQPGGQMTITTDVENFPGFSEVIQGPWLMEQMQLQAEGVGTKMISDLIVKAELEQKPFRLTGDSGDIYTCDALIISTGAQAKWLGLDSELKYQGFGVSACATCDGFFYKDKNVAVMTPDLICVVDSISGDGIGTEAIRYGQRVTILALPGPSVFKSDDGIALAGPRAFGFDLDFQSIF